MACVTLVGFGLLAGSLAAAWRQAKPDLMIRAVSSPATCAQALEMGLANECYDYNELEKALPGTDLLLLCAPISQIAENLKSLPFITVDKPILVSDIGSTKSLVCELGASLPTCYHFIGGHPMAGSEKRGVEHADATLFENAYWILCPNENIAFDYQLLQDLIEAAGAHTVVLNAQDHDRIMARLSHVPQLVSTALAAGLSPKVLAQNHQHLAGRGFRDMTRIAASPWPMWRDIIDSNEAEILSGIHEYRQSLDRIIAALETSSTPKKQEELSNIFMQGGAVRASLSMPGKGFSQALHEVFVELADHPGAILSVVEPLAKAQINLLDFEVSKVREGVGGTILLGFKTHAEATASVEILSSLGIKARCRG